MIHAHAHSLASAQGFALANPASTPRPQAARIAAMSSAIALNLLLFGVIMLPTSLPDSPLRSVIPQNLQLRIIPRPEEIKVVPIKPASTTPPPRPVQHPAVARIQAPNPPSDAAIAPTNVGDIPVTVTTPPGDTATGNEIGPDIASTPVQLAYRTAPPPVYPRSAMRMGLGGTVLLRILVDTDGHPLQVTVERSSGHRDLDEAARNQVLSRWLFQPAFRNGIAVQAYGLVPISFEPRR